MLAAEAEVALVVGLAVLAAAEKQDLIIILVHQ